MVADREWREGAGRESYIFYIPPFLWRESCEYTRRNINGHNMFVFRWLALLAAPELKKAERGWGGRGRKYFPSFLKEREPCICVDTYV